jgi:hypothetical protein
LLTGCANAAPRQPPGVPPTPATVTREEPGGDAHDPQRAALQRLIEEPWGWRNDKKDVVHFPLSDWPNWRRVRYWGVPSFVGFRYGDEHRAVTALWIRKLEPSTQQTPQACLEQFEAWAQPLVDFYRTDVAKHEIRRVPWLHDREMIVQPMDVEVNGLFSDDTWYGVVGAGLGWPGVCVVFGYAFHAEDCGDVAKQTRDRFTREAFSRLTLVNPAQPPDDID